MVVRQCIRQLTAGQELLAQLQMVLNVRRTGRRLGACAKSNDVLLASLQR